MLKFQITLVAILIACVAFVSCDRAQKMLDPVADDMTATNDTTTGADMITDMMKMIDSSMYMSWASKSLPAPTMTVAEAAAAGNAAGTGAAHNPGSDVFTSRTVYINDAGAMANKAGTAYPAGTIIVKEIMDETETFVDKVAVMMKSDDEMYAGHNGWVYKKYARSSADGEYMQVRGSNLEDAGNGCHDCHAKADKDSVFVSLSMDTMPETSDADGTGNTDANGGTDASETTLEVVTDTDDTDTDAGADTGGMDTNAGTDADDADAGDATLEVVTDVGGTDAGNAGESTEEDSTDQ